MTTVIVILLILVMLGLFVAERYFLFGRGRKLMIGKPHHWWNKPISRIARRVIGAAAAVLGIVLVILELRGIVRPTLGYVDDVILIVVGLLLAFGVLPRSRGRRSDDPGGS